MMQNEKQTIIYIINTILNNKEICDWIFIFAPNLSRYFNIFKCSFRIAKCIGVKLLIFLILIFALASINIFAIIKFPFIAQKCKGVFSIN